MHNLHRFIIILLLGLLPATTKAEEHIQKYVSNAKIVGQGRLSFWLWDVYDITLYAPHGKWEKQKPFALTLHYLMNLKGSDIAKRSIEEIRNQGFSEEKTLTTWQKNMNDIFPDVSPGVELTGVFIPGNATHFYMGNKKIGQINDPEFGAQFFNIWLGTKTSEPELRRQLIGAL